MLQHKIASTIPSCCQVDFMDISSCSDEEKSLIRDVFPDTNTIIVLAHHIKTSLEWAWFPLEAERNQNTCGADLHAKNVLERIERLLNDSGHKCQAVAYPGKCGIRMKDIANKTSMGRIGDSYLFLHAEWGPWTHLRLLLTDAAIPGNSALQEDVCLHCGCCISACPANAIGETDFDGIRCGQYQASQSNGVSGNYLWKCEICARVCPVGNAPLPLKIITAGSDTR